MTDTMTASDRNALIRIAKARGKQAERNADTMASVHLANLLDEMQAEYDACDALWKDAVALADAEVSKTNDVIRAKCAELGIPANEAPRLSLGWQQGPKYADRDKRTAQRALAEARLTAATKMTKTLIQESVLDIEEKLLTGGLESAEAQAIVDAMPTAEKLMPSISLDDIGVKRWQPAEGIVAALTTPTTTAGRRRRRVLRAIENYPGAPDERIAALAGVTVDDVENIREGEPLAIEGGDADDD